MVRNDRKGGVYDKREVSLRLDRERYYIRKLRQYVQYAYENSLAMRTKFDNVGINPSHIHAIKDLEKIPITTKDQLIELRKASPPFGGLFVLPQKGLQRIYMSPGPIYDPHTESKEFFKRYACAFYAMGFRRNDLVVNTWSYHMVPAGHWVDEALRQIGCTVIPMGIGNTELQLQLLYDLKPTGWCGTSSFLNALLTKAEERSYDISRDFKLEAIYAGGEMGGSLFRKSVEEKFGFIIRDVYGTADLGCVAYECIEANGMHFCEDILIEVVRPETGDQLGPGEVGHVIVTPLNKTYPLVRFGTGDLASFTDEPCSCGRSSSRLSRIMGRVGEGVRVRGVFVYPKQIRDLRQRVPEINRCQVIVSRLEDRDHLTIRVEFLSEKHNQENVKEKLEKAFPDICQVRIDSLEFVPLGTIPEDSKLLLDNRIY
jgi:phenylacetate-CoA ligase